MKPIEKLAFVAAFVALIVSTIVILGGCVPKTADAAAKAINAYCAATTDAERDLIRARVSTLIAPNRIRIECAPVVTVQ